jgi:hypothetical protein
MMTGDRDGGGTERPPTGVPYLHVDSNARHRLNRLHWSFRDGPLLVHCGPLLVHCGPRTKLVRIHGPVKTGPGRRIRLFAIFAAQSGDHAGRMGPEKLLRSGFTMSSPLDLNVVHNG